MRVWWVGPALGLVVVACAPPSDPGNNAADSTPPPAPTADTTRPTVQITSPANAEQIPDTLLVTGTAADNTRVARVTVTAGTQVYTASGRTAWSVTVPLTASGPMTITAVAEDTAGNLSNPATIAVEILPGWRAMPSPFPGTYSSTFTLRAAALGGEDTLLIALVGYTDPSLGNLEQADVFRWSGTMWFRDPFHSNNASSRFQVAVSGGLWAVGWVNDVGDVSITASNGLSWKSMGPVSALLDSHDPSIAFALGHPWLAYEQSGKLYVRYHDTWAPGFSYNQQTGGLTRSGDFLGTPVLAGSASDWYVAVHEPAGDCTSVLRGQGYAWLGACLFYDADTWPDEMVVFNNQPILLMRDGFPLHIARWSGSFWTGILTESNAGTTGYEVAVAGNRLYLLSVRPGATPPIRVRAWDGSTWTDLAGSVTSSGETVASLAGGIATYRGQPVVMYQTGSRLRVKRYLP